LSHDIPIVCLPEVNLSIHLVHCSSTNPQDPQDLCGDSDRRHLAALTAYVAVLLRGRVELRLEAKEALARPLEGGDGGVWGWLGGGGWGKPGKMVENVKKMVEDGGLV